ncbi:CBS domain-containing protein [Patescibacteria group bacterium]|nr:CBS domain-containing protein [Patescibacteria group bacterium]MBU1673911.1 CBS domain-containing protein [Patescibacteria group bacterium]MBU1963905.1 CBS domain-containing protein [Patescibacteria group bacterium]
MQVKDYMTTWVNTIGPDNTLEEAVEKMSEKKTNSLVVVDKSKKPIGVISSHLLIKEIVPEYLKGSEIMAQFGVKGTLAKYAKKAKHHKIKDFMYKDIHVLDPDDAMIEAATYVVEGARRVLPVVDKEGKLIGAITRTSVKIALHDALSEAEEMEKKGKQEEI